MRVALDGPGSSGKILGRCRRRSGARVPLPGHRRGLSRHHARGSRCAASILPTRPRWWRSCRSCELVADEAGHLPDACRLAGEDVTDRLHVPSGRSQRQRRLRPAPRARGAARAAAGGCRRRRRHPRGSRHRHDRAAGRGTQAVARGLGRGTRPPACRPAWLHARIRPKASRSWPTCAGAITSTARGRRRRCGSPMMLSS